MNQEDRPPPPPRSDEEAKLRLSSLGKEALRVLKDERPAMYQELAGREQLYLWAWDKQHQAEKRLGQLIEGGMQAHEAWELVSQDYIDLPPKE